MKNIIQIDEDLPVWIKNNPIKWCGILIFLGVSLAIFQTTLLGSKPNLFTIVSYSSLLLVVEFYVRSQDE